MPEKYTPPKLTLLQEIDLKQAEKNKRNPKRVNPDALKIIDVGSSGKGNFYLSIGQLLDGDKFQNSKQRLLAFKLAMEVEKEKDTKKFGPFQLKIMQKRLNNLLKANVGDKNLY